MSLGLLEILLVVMVFLDLGPRRIADLLRSIGRGATTSWTTWAAIKTRNSSKTRRTRISPASRNPARDPFLRPRTRNLTLP